MKPPGYRNIFKVDLSRTEGGLHFTVEALQRFRFIISFTDEKKNAERLKQMYLRERDYMIGKF